MVKATARRRQGYTHDVEIQGGHRLVIDEPEESGGANQGPSPTRTLAAALAACTAITMEMYADRKGWDVGEVEVEVEMEYGAVRACRGRSSSSCDCRRALSEDQVERLKVIAGKCPVHRALSHDDRGLDRGPGRAGLTWTSGSTARPARSPAPAAGSAARSPCGSAPRGPACCSWPARRTRSSEARGRVRRGRRPGRGRWPLDVTEPDAGERIVAAATESFGQLDVLVNNAGTSKRRSLDQVPDEDWQAAWELNVMAPLRAMRAAAPGMAERGWGRIVNVCSSAAKRPSAHDARVLGHQGGRALAVARVRRRVREARVSSSTPSAPARPSRSCGWSPAACSTSPPSSPAAASREEALAAAGARPPDRPPRRGRGDRRRDRLPVLGARLIRRRRRLERRRRHRAGDHLESGH